MRSKITPIFSHPYALFVYSREEEDWGGLTGFNPPQACDRIIPPQSPQSSPVQPNKPLAEKQNRSEVVKGKNWAWDPDLLLLGDLLLEPARLLPQRIHLSVPLARPLSLSPPNCQKPQPSFL
jgi:hypothetical protein